MNYYVDAERAAKEVELIVGALDRAANELFAKGVGVLGAFLEQVPERVEGDVVVGDHRLNLADLVKVLVFEKVDEDLDRARRVVVHLEVIEEEQERVKTRLGLL